MMYRRPEGEEESGSDWDELTPRHTAPSSPFPPVAGAPPPLHQSTLHDTSDPSILVHDATGPSTLNPSGSTSTQRTAHPPALVLDEIPLNLRQGTSIATTSSQGTFLNAQPLAKSTSDATRTSQEASRLLGKVRSQSQDTNSTARSHVIMEAEQVEGQGTRRHHFLGNLTSIETAHSPHPPPTKNVMFSKPVYRVQEETVGESPTVEEEVKEGEGLDLEDVVVMNKEYGVDLEFSTVSGPAANHLAIAHQPPHAYMHDVAKRCEGRSQRCVEEVCSSFRLFSDFIIAVILGSTQCLLHHVLRKLCCGLAHIVSDTLYKPCMTLCFNGFLWPLLAALVQFSRGVVLIVGPLLEVVSVLMSWLVQIVRACRLVSITNRNWQPQQDKQHHHI